MQTILGASGQIATELARELHRGFTSDLRLVSRNPTRVNQSDVVVPADLLDADQAMSAVKGSDTVYFTAGLPPNTKQWEAQFPVMLENALTASRAAGARFVYFDNTYMYPQDARPQTELTAFAPVGRKGKVRAMMASRVLEEMRRGEIPVLIARAPEFYGPGKTQSFTNALVIEPLKAGKTPRVPVRDDKLRTLIWTPDASRGLAMLGNAADAYGQTWHLPVSEIRPTYKQFVAMAAEAFGRDSAYRVIPRWGFKAAGLVMKEVREIDELLPRYAHDNVFESSKFKQRFPEFTVTNHAEGLSEMHAEWRELA